MDPATIAPAIMSEKIYWIVGALVVMNFGTILTVLFGIGKAVWFFAQMDARIKESKATAVRAHVRIDKSDKRIDDLITNH